MLEKTLYGLDKKGGFKLWTITTDAQGLLTIVHGKEGGKMQVKSEQVKVKNVGKANETSLEVQAENEALGRIKKQIDKGYREDKAELEDLPILPMLAGDYNKIGHRIKFPCYGNEKLDGVRCMAKKKDGVVTLESRTGQPYILDHVVEQLTELMEDGEIFDGEIYLHGAALQDITSAVKRVDTQAEIDAVQRKMERHDIATNPADDITWHNVYDQLEIEMAEAQFIHQLRPSLEFYIFDVVSEKPFVDRLADLGTVGALIRQDVAKYGHLWVMSYEAIESDEALRARVHPRAVSRGFEGVMLRNVDGMYESGKRSADLQKFKTFLDSEFVIVDVIEDKQGNAVFVLHNDMNSLTFQCVIGSMDERKRYIADRATLIGKSMTVQYQSRYKDTLLPQFPTGKAIRDYE